MAFPITLLFVFVACLVMQKPLRAVPWAFYALALLLDAAMIANSLGLLPQLARLPLAFLMRKGMLGVSLFVVVMYIGVLPRNGRLSRILRPVRAELSIMACLLIAGHMCTYLAVLLPQVIAGNVSAGNVVAAFYIAIVLLLLVVVLGVTSFRFVKRHMRARTWKNLQRFAYAFYALVYVHVLVMLSQATLSGSAAAIHNMIVYSAVFGVYLILRLWRAWMDRREKIDLVETVCDQGFND